MKAGAGEGTSQGDSEVLAEGNYILESNLASENLQNKKEKGAIGSGGVGKPRGEKGYGLEEKEGKQQWDPGSKNRWQD